MSKNNPGKRFRPVLTAGFAVLLAISILLSGCTGFPKIFQNPRYLYEDGGVLVNGADLPIVLKNNSQAANVSYKQLLDFIRNDVTDLLPYIERGNTEELTPFVCSDFALMVHDNAEAAGIRAGYVSINWVSGEIGHAINAFETTDYGVVFIDCTGKSVYSQVEEEDESQVTVGSWDKVAYLENGRKYGVIGLAYARSPEYLFYEQYVAKWQELREKLAVYNSEVKKYNQEIRSTVFVEGSLALKRIREWDKSLEEQKNIILELSLEVGFSRFRSPGIVDNYTIHW
ncbi:MAG TPA: hypothetical protein VLH15_05420 [Dehalococcoidales bacterium]|nr:hypothetical protein [Dehalococcoidales bacterium]